MSTTGRDVPFHFRAGRMTYENGIVTPCLQQGDLSFLDYGDFISMSWTSHAKSTSTQLPKGNTKVSFVEQCKTGRVLLFEVLEGSAHRLYFFWLQDKSTANDAEHLAALKSILAPHEPAVKIKQFEKILSDIAGDKKEKKGAMSLLDILRSPTTIACLNENTEYFISRLSPLLPDNDNEDIQDHLNSSEVKLAASVLSRQISDQAGAKEVCETFGLPPMKKTGIRAFLELFWANCPTPE